MIPDDMIQSMLVLGNMAIVSCGTVSLELNYLKKKQKIPIKQVLDCNAFEQIVASHLRFAK